LKKVGDYFPQENFVSLNKHTIRGGFMITLIKKLSVICAFAITPLFSMESSSSWIATDKSGKTLTFSWVLEGDLQEEKELYLKSFKGAYPNWPAGCFERMGIPAYIEKVFDQRQLELVNRYLVAARDRERLVACASFEKNGQDARLRTLVIDQAYKNSGIAEMLILSILRRLPATEKIISIVRKENLDACKFYRKWGFAEFPCTDMDTSNQWFARFEAGVVNLVKSNT